MKKQAALVLCGMLAMTSVLAGCGNGNENISSMVSEAGSQVESEGRVDTPTDAVVNKQMTVAENVYTKEKINVKYPIVGKMDVPESANAVNTLIQQDMLAVMDQYLSISPSYAGTFNYELLYNDGKILSIVYRGTLTAGDAAYPINAVFTTNINLEKGERMSSGAPEKAAEIANLLISGKGYEVVGEEELQQAVITALTAMEPETLTKTIAEADFGPDKKPTAFTAYAGENKVAVYLPVEHAIGDVAIVTLTLPGTEPAEGTQSTPEETVPQETTSQVNSSQANSSTSSQAPVESEKKA
ncbi:MAG: DUF4163 domain-containing protein [Clostridiales bacterium]|nr:DUF4163 domain-containing protein [Clostridiales bacterium]